jgi:hypothetical protein
MTGKEFGGSALSSVVVIPQRLPGEITECLEQHPEYPSRDYIFEHPECYSK